jgi:pseudaminic acid cytidylyltransferase
MSIINKEGLIAIIPARGGSKRIPKKNLKLFCGKPIIEYSIHAALSSGLFEDVIVSTDSEEIALIAERSGAKVPFMRSSENSDDFAGTADVLVEVLLNLNKLNLAYKFGCCIYPTAPLITIQSLKLAYNLLLEKRFNVVFPVLKYSYPIQRSLRLSAGNSVNMLWPENYKKRSQDFEPIYHDAGQFYWFNTSYIVSTKKLFGENVGALMIDELNAQDIDTEKDWEIAELKYKILQAAHLSK